MRLIVWGAGELGSRVLSRGAAAGLEGIGYTRTDKWHARLREVGATPRKGSPHKQLRDDDALLLSIAGSVAQYEALDSLSRTCPARAVLISSVGYFGNPEGEIDEASPAGTTPHAKRVAKTEAAFRGWAGKRGTILRLGGLYRAGRGPVSALHRRGSPPPGPPDRTLALIHYDDAAQAVFVALHDGASEPLYIGVTPPCPTREQFYRVACREAGLAVPAFTEPVGKPVANYDVSLLRRDLLAEPAYPDWRAATT